VANERRFRPFSAYEPTLTSTPTALLRSFAKKKKEKIFKKK